MVKMAINLMLLVQIHAWGLCCALEGVIGDLKTVCELEHKRIA